MKSTKELFVREMQLRNFSEGSQKSYLTVLNGLYKHFNRDAQNITSEEIKDYILCLQNENRLAPSTIYSHVNALKFLINKALKRNDDLLIIENRKTPKGLPEILSVNEVKKLIRGADNLRRRVMLLLAYSAGLRASEIVNLKAEDIDSQRMLIRIQNSKNRKDRYTILNPLLLKELRIYWKKYRPQSYFFPGRDDINKPACSFIALKAWRVAKRRSGIKKGRGVHTLRHCFATHLLEAGVDLRTIQVMMGHSSISTTAMYLKVTQKQIAQTQVSVDLLKYF